MGRGVEAETRIMANEQDSDAERQFKIFEDIRDRAFALLEQFGESGYQPPYESEVDYSVEGDFTGYPEVVVYVDNLKMLRPSVIDALQALIVKYPGWQITVTVTVRGHYDDWPNMVEKIKRDREQKYRKPTLHDQLPVAIGSLAGHALKDHECGG